MPERIAKVLARAGVCSRRSAEELIFAGRVKVSGQIIKDPSFKVDNHQEILVDNKKIKIAHTRLWLYYKPLGLVTTHKDEQDRKTVFANLPKNMPRVISIGRLDINSEGLLLLTNDGEFSRKYELPSSEVPRKYRVKVSGKLNPADLAILDNNFIIDKIMYKPIKWQIEKTSASQNWLILELTEGKNREIRKIFSHLNLLVSRLIRISYGEYELGDLPPNQVREVEPRLPLI